MKNTILKMMKREILWAFTSLAAIVLIFTAVTAQEKQATGGWRVALEEGQSTRATMTIGNRCSEPHLFRIDNDLKYLSFEGPTQSILIAPGSTALLWARFDATGLKSRVYEDDLLVECLDCKKEKATRCTQDRDKVPVQLTVTKRAIHKADFAANMILVCKFGLRRQNCMGHPWEICGIGFPPPGDVVDKGWVTAKAALEGDKLKIEFPGKLEKASKTIEISEDITVSGEASANISVKSLTALKGVYDVDNSNPAAPRITLNVRVTPIQNADFVPTADDYLKLANLTSDLSRLTLLTETLEATLDSDRLSPTEGKQLRQNSIAISEEMLEILTKVEKAAPDLARYQAAANERIKIGPDGKPILPSELLKSLSRDKTADAFLNKWAELNQGGKGLMDISNRLRSELPVGKELIGKFISEMKGGSDISPKSATFGIFRRIRDWFRRNKCTIGLAGVGIAVGVFLWNPILGEVIFVVTAPIALRGCD